MVFLVVWELAFLRFGFEVYTVHHVWLHDTLIDTPNFNRRPYDASFHDSLPCAVSASMSLAVYCRSHPSPKSAFSDSVHIAFVSSSRSARTCRLGFSKNW